MSAQVSAATSISAPIDVAVGILMRNNGEVLLGQRPPGKPYAGYWEFPGGKVEPGESILDALKREFLEELGITILSAQAWCCVAHVYPHAHVHLHFYLCQEPDWQGQAQSLEGQAFAWQGQVDLQPLLPATIPLLVWLQQLQPAVPVLNEETS
jgi:8-oxo-dGTP diphosphatase